ncbi:MAG: alpha-amylase family glycosyl hydrolase [Edaphocola sp.]
MKRTFLIMLLAMFLCEQGKAQVSTSPAFPVDGNGDVTITFHADQGNQALMNYSGDVYIHTGVILQGTSGWQNVVTTWGSTNAAWKMTAQGNNTYTYTITDIRNFYGVTTNQVIDSLAMLFRDATGNTVGRAAGGADIFVAVVQQGALAGSFTAPTVFPYFKTQAQSLNVTYITSQSADISIYENNVLNTSAANATTASATLTGNAGVNWVKAAATATTGTASRTDSFYYVNVPTVNTAALPAGVHDGVNYVDANTVTLVLVAPGKNYVCVVGEFNNWVADTNYFLNKSPDGSRWWITLTGLVAQQQYAYQYIVDGSITIADPYTDLVLDPDNDPYITTDVYPDLKAYPSGKTSGLVSVLQTDRPAYQWTAANYQKPESAKLMIYELLVRDFVSGHNYQQLIDTLTYLKNLGINAIELMPFNEFEGNDSWGYNVSFYFAPDKYYGTADKLKGFIDACHANGIAVIMDMVLNHSYGQSPLCQLYWDSTNGWPSADNPWYNTDCDSSTAGYQGKHPYGVGFDFNHESLYTKKLVADVVHYWVKEFKVDGYRFDLAKGFTQKYTGTDVSAWGNYDSSRIAIWEAYADSIRSVDTGTYIILEHFADNSEETVLADYGMMLWGNLNNAYAQSAMGYPTQDADLSSMSYLQRGWQQPRLVGYMESHDEERVMYKCRQYGAENGSGTYKIKSLNTALNRIKLNATFFFTIPGPKMIWQFGELGYDTSINGAGGRTNAKPILWEYWNIAERKAVYQHFKALLWLRNNYPDAFNTTQFTTNVGNVAMRSINLNDASMQVVAVGNFGTSKGDNTVTFPHTGWWYNYFSGDSLNVTTADTAISLAAGEYRLYLSQNITPPDGVLGIKGQDASALAMDLDIFPNPCKAETTVAFAINKSMRVTMALYDIAGKKVADIADRQLNAGNYSIDIDVSQLASGQYFLDVQGSGQRQYLKVSVVK